MDKPRYTASFILGIVCQSIAVNVGIDPNNWKFWALTASMVAVASVVEHFRSFLQNERF